MDCSVIYTLPCSFHFNSAPLCANTKAKLAAFMFLELVDTAEFDENKILRFCLAVSKNYRPIPYHNWEHAFSVTHCLYYIIIGAPHLFTYIEVVNTRILTLLK